jgi:dipeptidyl aminopeptidase/acylaminoacyl peptidase
MTDDTSRRSPGATSWRPVTRTRIVMPLHAPLSILALAALASTATASSLSLEIPNAPAAGRLGADWLSADTNDYNLSTDADRRLLVFGRSTTGDFQDAKIWLAKRDGAGWATPAPAPFSDARWRDSDPWLTPDGRWLYFVSNRPAPDRDTPREDLDLWRVSVTGGSFGTPEHLAEASSTGEELGPEVHNGWLVFNSTRKGGPAALALYRSQVSDGTVAAPEPLPAPFNDGLAQGDLTFSPDGRVALFWSIRGDSRDPDLFAVHRQGNDWSAAVRLPAPFNAPGMDFTPAFAADGTSVTWASQRTPDGAAVDSSGRADLYGAPLAELLRAL